jgi:hypothetical protein
LAKMVAEEDAATETPATAHVKPGGWRESVPLGPPPGINYVDQLCDAADRRERSHDARRT